MADARVPPSPWRLPFKTKRDPIELSFPSPVRSFSLKLSRVVSSRSLHVVTIINSGILENLIHVKLTCLFINCALIATMIVLSDISNAPNAGEMLMPQGASTPAASGKAMML